MRYLKQLKRDLRGDTARRKELLMSNEVYKQVGAWQWQKDLSDNESADGGYFATFRVTDSGVDREGDIILSAGMDIDNYEQSGSLLWGHRADLPELVLGAPVETTKQDTSIDVRFRFASQGENPTGAMVGRMVRAGIVQGTSVGIAIREYTEANDRGGFMPLNILASELLEVSVTPIPANPRATQQEAKDAVEYVLDETPAEEHKQTNKLVQSWLDAAMHKNIVAAKDPVVAAFLKAIG